MAELPQEAQTSLVSKRNMLRFLQEIPPATKCLALSVLVLSTVTGLPGGAGRFFSNAISLIPAKTIGELHLWNPLSSLFAEASIATGAVSSLIFLVVGKWLEPVWGQRELVKFVFIVNLLSGFALFLLRVAAYVATRNTDFYFKPVRGCGAVLAGFTVVLKQLIPEHSIGIYGSASIKAKHFTPVSILLSLILCVSGLRSTYHLLLCVLGAYFSWLYLRFFQKKETGRGDQNENFTFKTFFPGPLQLCVAPVSAAVFKIFAPYLRKLQTFSDEESQKVPTQSADDDLERRRQIAMKALNERLKVNLGDGHSESPPGPPA
mmetsp:Transcript_12761/g.39175  ORF Transcript_12761/g.39175 Transcript_12761/m.39175 type:complete len:319 (-) Transcript_12761:261-1217(-)|eukprot:CAMPEP_0198722616 /NCGR_PEP_ID=MMETSP1475-20131203/276_2 /TAXON_ID= ORGANISM="Unidentified sp., Strain CCMP1999" /NCGR_SAMPLE_ID=MMETSP1475 /ASSEMBLY_ACC=CAM_ASM_001111 /LENGTH=318 /DNA_ID=CAMNT_0044483527 /DNA_START=422 /DNA_END=1378 /DNA_ORIENTATION=-